jgi:hypothetical protein
VASKSHVRRYAFAALTAILQSEKLIVSRSGEALTLRVSPRGFLKRQGGATFGPPLPLSWHASSSSSLGRTVDPLHVRIGKVAADPTLPSEESPARRASFL